MALLRALLAALLGARLASSDYVNEKVTRRVDATRHVLTEVATVRVASDGPDAPLPFATWPFAPPYLPPGTTIPVALASEDPRQPFVFRSPGSARPDAWTDGRAGTRQRDAGLAEIAGVQAACRR